MNIGYVDCRAGRVARITADQAVRDLRALQGRADTAERLLVERTAEIAELTAALDALTARVDALEGK
ncbi:hypothetical protein ACWEN6_13875 [Sphaerisporangium sp. NPDC004334]